MDQANDIICTQVTCMMCKRTETINANWTDYQAWLGGKLIQDALPYLTPDERELLMSRICGRCFDYLYGEEDL
jgi:hypothetical protein